MSSRPERGTEATEEYAALAATNREYIRYVREKTDQLLGIMGTKPLNPEELDDRALLDLDPIGIIAESFAQILEFHNKTIDDLRRAKDELQTIFDATGVGISVIDRNFAIQRCNGKQRELLVEPTIGEVAGRYCYDVYCNRSSPMPRCPAVDTFATGQAAVAREVMKKGKYFQVVTTPYARDPGGEVTQVIEVSLDISEKKKAEAAEKEQRDNYLTEKSKLATIIESLSEGLLVLDAEDRVISCNRAADEITGRVAGKMLGQPLAVFFPAFASQLSCEADGLQGVQHFSYRSPDGEERLLAANLGRLLDAEGRSVGRVVTFRDSTEEKKRLELYHRAEKLAAIGQLSAGVAHELNTPLGSILGYARLLLNEKTLTPVQQERAAIIAEQAKKSSTIIKALLSFARQSKPVRHTLEACDLNAIIDQALPVLATELIKRKIELVTDLQPLPIVMADAGDLEQVVLNLVMNALQAIRRQGRIVVSTRQSGTQAIMRVEDDGPGIPEKILPRIFDPFFTTKPQGEGTGLGLAICSGIIGEIGGAIDVTSTPGGGATFVVSLPARPGGKPSAACGAGSQRHPRR